MITPTTEPRGCWHLKHEITFVLVAVVLFFLGCTFFNKWLGLLLSLKTQHQICHFGLWAW